MAGTKLLSFWLVVLVIGTGLAPMSVAAHTTSDRLSETTTRAADDLCQFPHPEWRAEQTIAGVHIQASRACQPDNPAVVAAATKGTNNVPKDVLMQTGLSSDAVTKHTDRDGDGDLDVIHITLEVAELNGFNNQTETVTDTIAPGIKPSFWVFTPKTRGMVTDNSKAGRLMRMPSPPIRIEEGDTVRVTLENTHYLPHTIHFHGVDHPFEVNGQGNDGVPQASEAPILPGENRTYEFTPQQAGTMFYHCHVVPQVHVLMGLNGMFIIEENRSNNTVQTFNIGAGKVRHPSQAIQANYTAEYDLQYQGVDKTLHALPKQTNDPRVLAKQLNREYDITNNAPDYFLLNGRSFPYTLWESQIRVQPNERYRLRILNGGSNTVSLHTHGHKFTIEAYDGVELAERNEITRDVASITAAQRVDLTLNTTIDGLHSYGKGVWFIHDHREQGVTSDGFSPGGTVSLITYESYLHENGMPKTKTNLSRYFSEAFYNGEVPFWKHLDPTHFGEPPTANNTTLAATNATQTTTTTAEHGGHSHEHEHAQSDTDGSSAFPRVPLAWVVGSLGVAGVLGGVASLRYLNWR